MPAHRIALPADLRSARVGRWFAGQHLSTLDPETVDVVVLLVSELVTNAVIHGGPHPPEATIGLSLELGADGVHVEVTDASADDLIMRSGAPEEPSGRGLLLVDHFATKWGCEQHRAGKTVWIDVTQPRQPREAPNGRRVTI